MLFGGCDKSIFDPDDLMERMMGDTVLARSIAEIFLSDIPARINMLKDRLNENDSRGAELQAHSINGAAANMAANKLQEVASRIEKASKAGNLRVAVTLITELEDQLSALEKEIKRLIL